TPGVYTLDYQRVEVESDHPIAGLRDLNGQWVLNVPEAHDPEDGGPVLCLSDQIAFDAHAIAVRVDPSSTTRPPSAKDSDAAASTRTTSMPLAASTRGFADPRATARKCLSSACSGSTLATRGIQISPSRTARLSTSEP